jgi:2-polyprenyl-3-methyl-5-hydroxy-6-metoxy-1,4-benzoquinol methylase
MNIEVRNKKANNYTGVRANVQYSNMLDQMRYIEALEYVKGLDVLDIACGVGWGSYLLAKGGANKVTGIDLSEDALLNAKKYYNSSNVNYILGNSSKIPVDSNSFDVIVSFETIEHVENPDTFIEELHRVSKKNTLLVLSTPNGYCFKNSINGKPENPFHFQEYLKDDIENMFNKDKWQIISYKGQYPMKVESKDIKEYQRFISNYWKFKRYISKFGLIGRLVIFVLSKLSLISVIIEPAYKDSCMPKDLDEGYEPAYHFFLFKCLK